MTEKLNQPENLFSAELVEIFPQEVEARKQATELGTPATPEWILGNSLHLDEIFRILQSNS